MATCRQCKHLAIDDEDSDSMWCAAPLPEWVDAELSGNGFDLVEIWAEGPVEPFGEASEFCAAFEEAEQ